MIALDTVCIVEVRIIAELSDYFSPVIVTQHGNRQFGPLCQHWPQSNYLHSFNCFDPSYPTSSLFYNSPARYGNRCLLPTYQPACL